MEKEENNLDCSLCNQMLIKCDNCFSEFTKNQKIKCLGKSEAHLCNETSCEKKFLEYYKNIRIRGAEAIDKTPITHR